MSDKLTTSFQQRITSNREAILPEPTIGNKRLADYIGNESISNSNTSISDPNEGRVDPQYSYPILVIELNTAYSKKVLEDELSQIENKYKTHSNEITTHEDDIKGHQVSIFILMDAETVEDKGVKTLVYWRKATIDIDFLNCLDELMINYRYLKSKGNIINIKEHFEHFLDFDDIGKNIIDDKVVLDFGLDKIEDDVKLSEDILFTDSINQSIPVDSIKDNLKDKPITIQDQISKELSQHQYEDLDDVNIDLTRDSVDILSQSFTNTSTITDNKPIEHSPNIELELNDTMSNGVQAIRFGQEV